MDFVSPLGPYPGLVGTASIKNASDRVSRGLLACTNRKEPCLSQKGWHFDGRHTGHLACPSCNRYAASQRLRVQVCGTVLTQWEEITSNNLTHKESELWPSQRFVDYSPTNFGFLDGKGFIVCNTDMPIHLYYGQSCFPMRTEELWQDCIVDRSEPLRNVLLVSLICSLISPRAVKDITSGRVRTWTQAPQHGPGQCIWIHKYFVVLLCAWKQILYKKQTNKTLFHQT